MISCHARDFERNLTSTRVPVQYEYSGTRVPGAQILGEYEVLLVPLMGISKPGNTRGHSGSW